MNLYFAVEESQNLSFFLCESSCNPERFFLDVLAYVSHLVQVFISLIVNILHKTRQITL